MCGILGIYNLDGAKVDRKTINKMGNEIAHRGPDGEGCYLNKNIGFIHKRLAILDTSERGKQPMISKDGNWVIVFNGCIYNFRELREELKQKGHKFISETDTEVIVEGFSAYGALFY